MRAKSTLLDPPLGGGTVAVVKLGQINVDRRIAVKAVKAGLAPATKTGYQRDITEMALKIGDKFDGDMWERPTVNKRRNGTLWAMDGGNRIAGAYLAGYDASTDVEVIMFEVPQKKEPLLFARLNKERKPVSGLDVFLAEVDAGEDEATSIQSVLVKHGLRIGYPNGTPGLRAVTTVKDAFRKGVLDETAQVLVPWAEYKKGVEAAQIQAVVYILTVWQGWDLAGLVATAEALSPVRLAEWAYSDMIANADDARKAIRANLVGHVLSPYMAMRFINKYRDMYGKDSVEGPRTIKALKALKK